MAEHQHTAGAAGAHPDRPEALPRAAAELRAQGLTYLAIGRQLGVNERRAAKLVKKAREMERARACGARAGSQRPSR